MPEEQQLPEQINNYPVFDASDASRLHKALEKLKPHHKEVLTLCFIEQMSHQAISEVTQCNIGTIKSRLYYAKQALKKEMEKRNE